jgi:hypothetical protein
VKKSLRTRSRDGAVTTPATDQERAFLEAARAFSDYHLPCRGWYRVLQVGAGAGGIAPAVLLAERGHEVTVTDVDDVSLAGAERRFAATGLHATFLSAGGLEQVVGQFDAVSCFDPAAIGSSPYQAATVLRRGLRHRGLFVAGPAFAVLEERDIRRAGFKHGPDFPTGFSLQAARTTAGIGSRIGRQR